MDDLDRLILEREKDLAEIQQRIEILHSSRDAALIELNALRRAATLRPILGPTSTEQKRGAGSAKRGKQAGSISSKWKDVLRQLVALGNEAADYSQIFSVALNAGIEGKEHSVRDRVRKYRDHGFFKEVSDGKFVVTDEAMRRFNLSERDANQSENARTSAVWDISEDGTDDDPDGEGGVKIEDLI